MKLVEGSIDKAGLYVRLQRKSHDPESAFAHLCTWAPANRLPWHLHRREMCIHDDSFTSELHLRQSSEIGLGASTLVCVDAQMVEMQRHSVQVISALGAMTSSGVDHYGPSQ